MSTGETWTLGHRPALDGLRGIAILLVMVGHWFLPVPAHAGTVGVTVFFTLSGFLITTLLLEERERRGRFDLRAFYWRRARRLMPALYVAILASIPVTMLVVGGPIREWDVYLGAATYTTNFVVMDGVRGAGPGHTWSLAIEEQFYVLWPLLLIVTARLPRRWLLVLLLYGAFASLAMRVHIAVSGLPHAGDRIYFGLDTRADSLLIGCALAVFMHRRIERQPRRWLVPLGCALVVLMAVRGSSILIPLIAGLGTAAVIYGSVQGTGVRWLTSRPLRFCGRRAYGYYLFESAVGVLPVVLLGDSTLVRMFLMTPLSWGLAMLSWKFVEAPILSRGKRDLEAGVRSGALESPKNRGDCAARRVDAGRSDLGDRPGGARGGGPPGPVDQVVGGGHAPNAGFASEGQPASPKSGLERPVLVDE